MALAVWGIYGLSGDRGRLHLGYLALSVAAGPPVYLLCLWLLGEAREQERLAAARLWTTMMDGLTGRRKGDR